MKYIEYISKYPVPSIGVFITILPIILLLSRKELNTPLRLFTFYLISKLVLDLIAFHLASYKINNLLIGNISVLSSLLIISAFFYFTFLDDKTRRTILIISIVYGLIFLFDFIYSNVDLLDLNNHRYVTISTALRSGVILLFCLLFFSELIQELYISDLSRSAIFWCVCGLIVYHSVCLFSTALFNACYRWNFNHKMNAILHLQYYFEVVFMIIVSIGVVRYKKVSYLEK